MLRLSAFSKDEGDILVRFAIIGGGIGGMAAALFLARRGHAVTVFERDEHQPSRDLDQEFFSWHRPGVPQAVQPHGLLAPVRGVLRAEAADVYAEMLRMGALEHYELRCFDSPAPPRPGDDELVTIQTRRIVLEAALSEAVEREPSVRMRRGDAVLGLVVEPGRSAPRVRGVRSVSGSHSADLVLDAAGRRSPVLSWLARAGCREAVVERQRIGIAYFCRWYRLRADGPRNPGLARNGSATSFAAGGVFPSENGTFAASLTVSTADPTRGTLRDPRVFEQVARTFPAIGAWLALEPEPLSAVLTMGGLENRWTSLIDVSGPVVTGLIGIGDASIHTNPTMGQGAALALRAAQWVAHHADEVQEDAWAFAMDYHRWASQTLYPWFATQVAADAATQEQLRRNLRAQGTTQVTGAARVRAAREVCAWQDPVVMRARAQVRHLILHEEQAYGAEEVRARVERWLEEHPGFIPTFDGPQRAAWEAATRQRA